MVIGLLLVGCVTYDPHVNTSLNGVWTCNQFTITINGNSAVFSEINYGPWINVLNNRLLSIGSQKIRGISQTGNLSWTGIELTWWADDLNNNNTYRIGEWSNCTITMNRNGRSIQIRTQGVSIDSILTYTIGL